MRDRGPHERYLLPMALARWGANSPALLALAGAAGGGGLPWALWALQSASDPHVQEVVAHAGAAGARAASAAASWIEEAVDVDDSPAAFCVPTWQLQLAVAVFMFFALAANFLLACCCGPLGFLGGRLWARPWEPQASAHNHLEQLAKFLETGGPAAVEVSARELGVTPEALREWWVHWQFAHRGPRRAEGAPAPSTTS